MVKIDVAVLLLSTLVCACLLDSLPQYFVPGEKKYILSDSRVTESVLLFLLCILVDSYFVDLFVRVVFE